MMTHNNQIFSFKTLCFINECFILFLLKWNLNPATFSMVPYLLEIYHVMIFSSTCEMQLVAYHNIIMSKNVNNPFNLNKTSLQLYCD